MKHSIGQYIASVSALGKRILSMFMVLALVVTTSFPGAVYAMPQGSTMHSAKPVQSAVANKGDCHALAIPQADVAQASPTNSAITAEGKTSPGLDPKHDQVDVQSHAQSHAQPHSGACCDKGMCSCIGDACSHGLSKAFYPGGGVLFSRTSSRGGFTFTDDIAESTRFSRVKRPPKA